MRVRLCDVDPAVRQAAARRLMRREADPRKCLDLVLAAIDPSDKWYVVSDDAADMVRFVMTGHRDTLGSPAAGADNCQ